MELGGSQANQRYGRDQQDQVPSVIYNFNNVVAVCFQMFICFWRCQR